MAGWDLAEPKTASSGNLGKREVTPQTDLKRKLANWMIHCTAWHCKHQYFFVWCKKCLCMCVCHVFYWEHWHTFPLHKIWRLTREIFIHHFFLPKLHPMLYHGFSKAFRPTEHKAVAHALPFSSGKTCAVAQTFTPLLFWGTFLKKSKKCFSQKWCNRWEKNQRIVATSQSAALQHTCTSATLIRF